MANLRSTKTGVEGAVIWISAGEFESKKSPHGPRVKVAIGSKMTTETLRDAVSITIAKNPKVLGDLPSKIKKQAVEFVKINMEPLLKHWRGELDSDEVLREIRRV